MGMGNADWGILQSAFGIPHSVGDVAQTGEHLLCKQGVSGSIPLISTTLQMIRAEAVFRLWRNSLFDN